MARVDVSEIRKLRSWNVMTVNNTWQLAPWAAAMYAGDSGWWDRYGDEVCGFQGERWTRDEAAAMKFRLHLVRKREGKGLCRERGYVHTGGNSGFQAVNLAWHFGAKRIVLLGFDMHRQDGGHWHGEHHDIKGRPMLSAPKSHISVWRTEFQAMAFDLRAEGVSVVNATEGTALTCFPRAPLARALR
jgi:hypothetical protein